METMQDRPQAKRKPKGILKPAPHRRPVAAHIPHAPNPPPAPPLPALPTDPAPTPLLRLSIFQRGVGKHWKPSLPPVDWDTVMCKKVDDSHPSTDLPLPESTNASPTMSSLRTPHTLSETDDSPYHQFRSLPSLSSCNLSAVPSSLASVASEDGSMDGRSMTVEDCEEARSHLLKLLHMPDRRTGSSTTGSLSSCLPSQSSQPSRQSSRAHSRHSSHSRKSYGTESHLTQTNLTTHTAERAVCVRVRAHRTPRPPSPSSHTGGYSVASARSARSARSAASRGGRSVRSVRSAGPEMSHSGGARSVASRADGPGSGSGSALTANEKLERWNTTQSHAEVEIATPLEKSRRCSDTGETLATGSTASTAEERWSVFGVRKSDWSSGSRNFRRHAPQRGATQACSSSALPSAVPATQVLAEPTLPSVPGSQVLEPATHVLSNAAANADGEVCRSRNMKGIGEITYGGRNESPSVASSKASSKASYGEPHSSIPDTDDGEDVPWTYAYFFSVPASSVRSEPDDRISMTPVSLSQVTSFGITPYASPQASPRAADVQSAVWGYASDTVSSAAHRIEFAAKAEKPESEADTGEEVAIVAEDAEALVEDVVETEAEAKAQVDATEEAETDVNPSADEGVDDEDEFICEKEVDASEVARQFETADGDSPIAEPETEPPTVRRREKMLLDCLPYVILLFATLPLFCVCVNGDWYLDEVFSVARNPYTWHGSILQIFSHDFWGQGNWRDFRPLVTLSYRVQAVFSDWSDFPSHLRMGNCLIHSANTCMMWWFLRLYGLTPKWSRLGALLFAWHPLHVENTAYIVGRCESMSAFFGILAVISYFNMCTTRKLKNAAAVFALAAGLCDLSGLTLLAAVILAIPLRVPSWPPCRPGLLVGLFLCVRYVSSASMDFVLRQGRAFFSLSSLVLPVHPDALGHWYDSVHPPSESGDVRLLSCFTGYLLLAAAICYTARHKDPRSVAAVCMTVLPALIRAEQEEVFTGSSLYLSTISWTFIMVTSGATQDKCGNGRWWTLALSSLAVAYLGISCWRMQQWNSRELLFQADGRQHPGTAAAMRSYAAKLRQSGNIDEAIANYLHSLQLDTALDAHYAVAQLYLERSQFDLAYVQYQAMKPDHFLWPGFVEPSGTSFWADYGYVLASVGRYEDALTYLLKARNTVTPFILNTMAYTYAHLGYPLEAMNVLLEALKLDENDALLWNNGGVLALHFAGDYEHAKNSILRAVQLNSENDLFRRNLNALQIFKTTGTDSPEARPLLGLHYHHRLN